MPTPTLRELLGLEAKQTRLRTAADRWLLAGIRALQAALLRQALASAAAFVFRGGALSLTIANTRRAGTAALAIEAEYQLGARALAGGILERILNIIRGNTAYFAPLGDAKSVEEEAIRRVLMLYGYDPKTRRLVPGGYLDGVLGSAPVARAVGARMNTALLGGMGVGDFRALFRAVFAPRQGRGLLEQHFDRVTNDLFMQVDRVAKDIYAEELGLVHFIYAGTEVERSRYFCVRRMNRIYTMDFARGWDALDWAGKIPGLLFEVQMGGYRCRHSKMYISPQLAAMLAKRDKMEINTLGPAKPPKKRD